MRIRLRRRTRLALLVAAFALLAGPLGAHDLFLKLSTYFLPPNTAVNALLLNGTFTVSENSVSRDRIADVSLVGPGGRTALDTTALSPIRDSTHVRFRTGESGTYVAGLSVRPREISLSGPEFNGYLKEEGLEDVVAERTRTATLGDSATERYAKHVKAVFQVGDRRSEEFSAVLGYPAEIVPVENPYTLTRGEVLQVRCLVNGQPAGGLTVLAGGRTRMGARIQQARATTDANGVASVRLTASGRWYVKFISMRRSSEPGLTHESQWATLTFEAR
ncbi:MAG: DUF4198 domain-containing protein [Gemmatimonadales bacterium]